MATQPEALVRARAFLRWTRLNDGSWPYVPGKPAAVEPTCYAAMALGDHAPANTVAWLDNRTQHPTNAQLQWEQLLTLLTFRRLSAPPDLSGPLVQRVLNVLPQQPG